MSELRRLLPVFCRVAKDILGRIPGARFVVAQAPGLNLSSFVDGTSLEVVDFDSLFRCDSVLCCSGTATLELALSGVPLVVAYKLSFPSYVIGRA